MANFPKELWDKVSSTVIPAVQGMLSALGETVLGTFKTTSQKGGTANPIKNEDPPPSIPNQTMHSSVLDPATKKENETEVKPLEEQKIASAGPPLLTKYEKDRNFAKGILELAKQKGPNDPSLEHLAQNKYGEIKIKLIYTQEEETPKPTSPKI